MDYITGTEIIWIYIKCSYRSNVDIRIIVAHILTLTHNSLIGGLPI